MQAILTLLREFLAWLEGGRIGDLLSSRHHTPYLARHRLAAVVTRIRLAAAAFSVLTLLWIPLDAMTLPRAQWSVLAAVRVVAVVLFALLALLPEREMRRPGVLALLGAMLAAPMAIYAIAGFLVDAATLTGLAVVNARLYQALPFIVLAGLSLFPLVATEGLMFALPIAAIAAAVQFAHSGSGADVLSTLWVLALTLGVYLLACAIQLHYMMALLRRASLDPLTGALTRRSGMEVLEFQFRLACDQDTPLAVAFLDIDDFKSINDSFGHDAGDAALRAAAAALGASLRQADVVIRWGGEEFVVVFVNTPLAGVRIVMARILEEWLGQRPDGALLTASIGVAERTADATTDWVRLVGLADTRMYAAKTGGKARCVVGEGLAMLSSQQAAAAGRNQEDRS